MLPIRYRNRAEVAVERVTLPTDVRRNQPFDLRVVFNNSPCRGRRNDSGEVHGQLVSTNRLRSGPRC